ncbi:MAG: 2-aminoethylphosphonate--pyruvate transaminase [Nitrospinae bacterium CG11_big_fil_rev_8_21_14_0_20_45_15]|nr:MAG: 2-aminoethylphosphonate--pyruvate transaminase [Nitrospinae bacterium CG11_big_fil_rev_8_21_14_0_20_45_15]
MTDMPRKILLNPGPGTTSQSVKDALVVEDICPREKEFQEVMENLRRDLVKVVHAGNDYDCVMFAGSGTAVMDACINSVVPPDKKILIVNNGAYGMRLAAIAKAYGIAVEEMKFAWDSPPSLQAIEEKLASDADGSIACIAMVHHETTTGLLNPVKETGALAQRYGKTFIVDGISSYAAIPIDIEACHIDYLLSTSNKCIQGMAGISFVIAKISALESAGKFPSRSYYLDLCEQYAYMKRTGQMTFTAPVQIVYALQQAVKEYFDEGAEKRRARYSENWDTLYEGLAKLGFQFLLKPEHESKILLSVREPTHPDFDFNVLHDRLYARGFTIYPGKIDNTKTFRLAVIGDLRKQDMLDFRVALEETLAGMGIQHPLYI